MGTRLKKHLLYMEQDYMTPITCVIWIDDSMLIEAWERFFVNLRGCWHDIDHVVHKGMLTS